MALNTEQIKTQATAFVRGLTLKQKVTLAVGTAAVAGTIWVFVALLGKADYKVLYSGLSSTDAQSLSQRLAEKNIPYQLSSDGASILVPADQVDKARLNLASEGMPQSGRMGFELFDKPNWAGSDFAEKVNYQRALEGELERTIQTLGEVQAVRVHLVMPQESLFTDQERAAKASVVIKLRAGQLSDDAQEAITHLVAGAVDNLKPENVTLINADGGMPIMARGSGTSGRSRAWAEFESELAQKAVSTLEPVVGPGKARANVTVEYDLSTSDTTQEAYDPNGSVVLTSQTSEERDGGNTLEGAPGTPSNVPGKQPATGATTAGDADSQGVHTESKTFAVSKTVRHTMQPSGMIRRIAAAVIVDDATDEKMNNGQRSEIRRKRTPEEMKQIEDLVSAAIGIDATRGDKLAVENLSFQTLPLEPPSPPTIVQRIVPFIDKWVNVIRYGALVLLFLTIYLLVLRPIKRQIVGTFRDLPKQLGMGKDSTAKLPAGAPLPVKADGSAQIETSLSQPGESPAEVNPATQLKKNLLEKVKKEPASAGRLIQSWIRQEGRS